MASPHTINMFQSKQKDKHLQTHTNTTKGSSIQSKLYSRITMFDENKKKSRYRSKPATSILTDSVKATSRFAAIENYDVCNQIGVQSPLFAPALTQEEITEKNKNMLSIFDDVTKKNKDDFTDEDFTMNELKVEISKM